ncbi:DUF6510 family protein [Bradyrhizobium sp. CCBAU 53380]|uniref:DUF6510 family protein n=1 Tax=Bradyrhizobium sp. CCBAU 53380 TaxID=1325117 RepID=UPI002302C8C8|nr:DUF6510 family protein [Bradyrhizobium sp. CCBAU 53380]
MTDNISDVIIGGDPAAQLLQDVFAFDITLSKIECCSCKTVSGLGSLVANGGPVEAIVRCTICGNDLLRAVRTKNGHHLELGGARHLYF